MRSSPDDYGVSSPIVSERQCGGWIARSPDGAELKIAVTALTEVEVRAQFKQSVERWLTALQAKDLC